MTDHGILLFNFDSLYSPNAGQRPPFIPSNSHDIVVTLFKSYQYKTNERKQAT